MSDSHWSKAPGQKGSSIGAFLGQVLQLSAVAALAAAATVASAADTSSSDEGLQEVIVTGS
jgi:hypothetical protein